MRRDHGAPQRRSLTVPLDLVRAWGRAMDELDREALLGLAHEQFEIVTLDGTRRDRDSLGDWLSKQSYGVVPRFEPRRAFARDGTVVVELHVELRYVDGGEVAGSSDAGTEFLVEDGLIRRVVMYPDLAPALAAAGLVEGDEVGPL